MFAVSRRHPINLFQLSLGSVLWLAASSAAADVGTAIDAYLEDATSIVAELEGTAPDANGIADRIATMLENAKPVTQAYGERHPPCAAQLTRMTELYPEIEQWSALEIRRNIEAGASLPPAQGCYPARDVVAHPAIVRALARSGISAEQQPRLVREMHEAIEHMQEIQQELDAR